MEYREKYTGKVFVVNNNDYAASGGQADIYLHGSSALKIFKDKKKTLPEAKIQELMVLDSPEIISPKGVLIDSKNNNVGYWMKAIPKNIPLCKIFPPIFRKKNNITPDTTLSLIRKLQSGIEFIHSKNILVVDMNELNFLISENFKDLFFIDVDSYETKSFPAEVLMPSARDWHVSGRKWTNESDWFSFGLLAFNMFVGIHPYKGTYEPFEGKVASSDLFEKRCLSNISVLNPEVKVPPVVLPFSVIPPVYLNWFKAIFEKGERVAPPKDLVDAVKLVTAAVTNLSNKLNIKTIFKTEDSILWFGDKSILTNKHVFTNNIKIDLPIDCSNGQIIITPKYGHQLLVYKEFDKIKLYNLKERTFINETILGESFFVYSNQVFVKYKDTIKSIVMIERDNSIVVGEVVNCNVMPKSSYVLDGFVVQDILNNWHLTLCTEESTSYNIKFKEFSGKPLEGKFENGVLIMTGVNTSGKYTKYILKFNDDFSDYNCRTIDDEQTVTFTVRDNGVCTHVRENNDIELFSNKISNNKINTLNDPAVAGAILGHDGSKVLILKNNEISEISLK